jgi:hypothetical protein
MAQGLLNSIVLTRNTRNMSAQQIAMKTLLKDFDGANTNVSASWLSSSVGVGDVG